MKLFAHLISNGVYIKEDGTFAFKESRLLITTEEKPKPVIYAAARYTFDKRKIVSIGPNNETVYTSNVKVESFSCGDNNDFSKWLEDIKSDPTMSMITKDAGVYFATYQDSWDGSSKVMDFDLTKTQATLNDTEKVSELINLLVTLSPEEYKQVIYLL